jgi:starch-binding outer membrane protein, SusD/RagB family
MKRFKYIFILAALVVTSCAKEVLDKQPLDIISDNVVWSDPSLVDAYLTECYAETYVFHNVSVDNSWNYLWYGSAGPAAFTVNIAGDESKTTWFAVQDGVKYGGLTIAGGYFEWWENAYLVIRRLNQFIRRVPESPLPDDLRVLRTAEARWLRAYNFFEMVKRYGGVPLILIDQDANMPEGELYPPRNKEQEVYDFVLSEMDAISADLPEVGDYSRPTKYAALALKCRAALYAASIAKYGTVQLDGIVGIDASKADNYYQQAYDAAALIINGGKYELYNKSPDDKVANFRNAFLDKSNPETIFAVIHNSNNGMGNGGNGWAYDFFQCPLPNGWGAGGQNGAYLEMAEEFEHVDGSSGKLDHDAIQQGLWTTEDLWANKDPRFYATLYTQNTLWKGSPLEFYKGIIQTDGTTIQTDASYNGVLANGNQQINGTCFGVLKYLDEGHYNLIGLNGDWADSKTDWIVFRYGEVLLNYAEAAINLGKTGDALTAVNQIRERAGIAQLASIDDEKLRHERKVELAFEGHRYWDLRRWRTATTVLSDNWSGLRYILDYNTRKYKLEVIPNIDGVVAPPVFYEQNYYLPITIARTGNNPNLVENPGY